MDQILLHRPTGRRYATLREITGAEEQAITNTTTIDAIKLLQSLLVSTQDIALSADEAGGLTTWERDRLLAVLYTRIYGPRIDTSIQCENCSELFDLDFVLQTLMDNLEPSEVVPEGEEEKVAYFLHGDIRFRLPTADDECAVFGLPPERAESELLQRCLIDSAKLNDDTSIEIQKAMQTLSPVVNVDLDAPCPECGHEQRVQFDLQRYLLTALMNDRRQLVQEIHLLASAYGWNLSEILNLTRSQRRAFVTLVDADDALQKVRGV